jgi:hypothetical protein
VFGKVVHPPDDPANEDAREAYVGVFSNQRPEWLDQDFHLYKIRLEAQTNKAISDKQSDIDNKLDDLEDKPDIGYIGRQEIEIVISRSVEEHYVPHIDHDTWVNAVVADLSTSTAPILADHMCDIKVLAGLYVDLSNLQRIWKKPLPADYFANRDWYVEGKNIWIIQVGCKEQFGSFESFMDRVSSARVHISDTGDMECTYDIPKPDGSADRLTLDYGNGGQFQLNGGPFQTDLYPRFENPFVRGGRVEWGQRQYVLEWNGTSLLHDLTDFENPVRQESPPTGPADAETITALVIYFTTGDEAMDAFTIATATVDISCAAVASGEVVAAGPIDEDTQHDADWIFFDMSGARSPAMTITVSHPASTTGDATPEWTASFSLKALMGDRTLKDCQVTGVDLHFVDQQRTIGPIPFTVTLSAWTPWQALPDAKSTRLWVLADHPPSSMCWHDFNDLVVLDTGNRLWHRRLTCGGTGGIWEAMDSSGGPAPDWTAPFSIAAMSDQAGGVEVVVVTGGRLLVRSRADRQWSAAWTDAAPGVPLGPKSAVSAAWTDQHFGGFDLYLTGSDGTIYRSGDWSATTSSWDPIPVDGFTVAAATAVQAADGYVFALGDDRAVWASPLITAPFGIVAGWQRVTEPGFAVTRFAVGGGGPVHLAVLGTTGEVRTCSYEGTSPPRWSSADTVDVDTSLAWAQPTADVAWLFACGADGTVGYLSDSTWVPAGTTDSRVAMSPSGGLAAACRAIGQVEVFSQARTGELMRAWWS